MTGKPMLDKIILAVNLLFLLAGLGVVLYTQMIYKRPIPEDAKEFANLIQGAREFENLQTFKIENLIINLPATSKRLRFLNIEVHFLPEKSSQMEIFESLRPLISDILYEVIGRMTPEELNTVTGKILLESRLKKEVNALKEDPFVKKIFFTKFIVQ